VRQSIISIALKVSIVYRLSYGKNDNLDNRCFVKANKHTVIIQGGSHMSPTGLPEYRRSPQITADHYRSPDSLLLGPADDLTPKIRKQVVQR